MTDRPRTAVDGTEQEIRIKTAKQVGGTYVAWMPAFDHDVTGAGESQASAIMDLLETMSQVTG